MLWVKSNGSLIAWTLASPPARVFALSVKVPLLFFISVMYVRLPDDYKFVTLTVSPEQITASPAMSTTDAADTEHADSPVTEAVLQSITDDTDTPAASSQTACRVPRRSSAARHQSSGSHLHLPRFQRRRTTRRRVAVSTSFITAANTDTDSGV